MNVLNIAQQQLSPDALQPIIDTIANIARMALVFFVEIAKIIAPAMIAIGLIGALIAPGTWKFRFQGMLITGAIILVVTYYLLPTLGWI